MRYVIAATLIIASAATAPAQTLFAPGAISVADSGDAFGALTRDGKEFYFTRYKDWSTHRMMVSKNVNGQWRKAELLPFSGTFSDREPKLSVDGNRLYFGSNRPLAPGDTAKRGNMDIWYSDRNADGSWGAPKHIDAPLNSERDDFSPVVTADGTLYFISTRPGGIGPRHNVWRAPALDLAAGKWGAPVNAGPTVNAGYETNVYVNADESLMLVSRDRAPGNIGGDDLWISRRVNGAWVQMHHLPEPVNHKEYDYGPMISPDGHWLYFTSHRTGNGDIYRISIADLEKEPWKADREAVKRAALDYLEAFYEGDTAKLVRAFRPDMFKVGFHRDSTGRYSASRMTFDEAIAYTKRVKARNAPLNTAWPKHVEVYEVLDQTASAKVTAWWGVDYLLLAKYDGKWMISSVMWQGPH